MSVRVQDKQIDRYREVDSRKLDTRVVTQEKAKLELGLSTETYAKRNAPVTNADMPMTHRLPKRVPTK
ncbi:hypothetical protein KEM55_005412 [Ascosphaera atra]|nr:hypothetical protein KEM55_005412 [Ascosphaera atra]